MASEKERDEALRTAKEAALKLQECQDENARIVRHYEEEKKQLLKHYEEKNQMIKRHEEKKRWTPSGSSRTGRRSSMHTKRRHEEITCGDNRELDDEKPDPPCIKSYKDVRLTLPYNHGTGKVGSAKWVWRR